MTRTEHLLVIVAEECAEVAQRAAKALRFGLEEIQEGQSLTNAERLLYEYSDLVATLLLLARECPGVVGFWDEALEAKRQKIEKFLQYSARRGTLNPAAEVKL